MSDRLKISASVSVMMMAIYALLGNGAARAPLAEALAVPVGEIAAPAIAIDPARLLPIPR